MRTTNPAKASSLEFADSSIQKMATTCVVPTNAGWGNNHAGGGGGYSSPGFQRVDTSVTAGSVGLFYTDTCGLAGSAGNPASIDWSKKLIIEILYARQESLADALARFQLKTVSTEGALAAAGIGIRADDFTLYGESYGGALGVVDLTTLLTNLRVVKIQIKHYVTYIEWWVNDVLKGTQSTANNIPSGVTDSVLVHSITTPGGGGVPRGYIGRIRINQIDGL